MFSKLSAQVRDNPLSLLLLSAGFALLVTNKLRNDGYQGGFSLYRDDAQGDLIRRTADPTAGFGYDEEDYAPSRRSSTGLSGLAQSVRSNVSEGLAGAGERLASQASSVRGSVNEGLSTMRDTYSSTTEAVSNRAAELRETASETFADVSNKASDYTDRARSGLATLAHEQPLVLGALGLLAGAALAAMLPRTQVENEYMGSTAQRLRDEARLTAESAYERAKHAASKAAESAAEIAREEFAGAAGEEDKKASTQQIGDRAKSSGASGSTGGPQTSENASSQPGKPVPTGASALGVSSGAGGARPTEAISSASENARRS
ncbi:MAG: hypothetical protein Q7T73_09510 [Beijerinckiaceae bacterium]|nr:hypothetical protein [Beijerinckiaceae bacterium]